MGRVARPPTPRRRISVPRLLVAGAAVIGVCSVAVKLPELLTALSAVTAAGPVLLPLGLALVALGTLARAVQVRTTSGLCGVTSEWRRDLELSATSYATNRVVKSGGFAGLVHHLADADRHRRSRRGVTLAYMTSKVADMLAFSALVALTVGVASAAGALTGPALVAAIITLGYAILQVAALWLLSHDPDRLHALVRRLRAAWARLRHRPAPSASRDALDDVAEVLAALRANPRAAAPVLASALAAKLVGLATLALVVNRLGLSVGPVAIAVIFMLGLTASMLGPLPGGIGTTEVSLAAFLATAGVAVGTATTAVVAFRLFDFWLPTLAGFGIGACTSTRRAHHTETALDREPCMHAFDATPV